MDPTVTVSIPRMNPIVYVPAIVSAAELVSYWSAVYPEADDAELYTPNIGSLSPQAVRNLFRWKFGGRFAAATGQAVDAYVIPRLSEIAALPRSLRAHEFLERFAEGGAIFRVFLLHCWQPDRFPIYDQHVHRAMAVIENSRCEEIEAWSDSRKVAVYLERYIPFHAKFSQEDHRAVDRALWAFGKFMKNSRLPGGCKGPRGDRRKRVLSASDGQKENT
jgi:hypothetical protein